MAYTSPDCAHGTSSFLLALWREWVCRAGSRSLIEGRYRQQRARAFSQVSAEHLWPSSGGRIP
eukprot:4387716-Prymnesium_polylepis.1